MITNLPDVTFKGGAPEAPRRGSALCSAEDTDGVYIEARPRGGRSQT